MQAVVLDTFGTFENGKVMDIPRPVPGPDDILIEVHAAPVNYVDLVVAAGSYQFPPPLPYTPGKGPAGLIVARGANVKSLNIGDRILGMAESGGYAEYALAPAKDCYRIPDSMTFMQAGAMSLAYDTAWFALTDRAQIAPGDSVLVLGATSAVGRACLQLAKAMGARTIGAVSSQKRAVIARAAGADDIVDLSAADLRNNLRDQVFNVTDHKGADILIDMLGGDPFDAAIRALAWRGRAVIVGFAAGRIPTLKINYLMLKNIAVSGLQVSDYRKRRPDMMARCYESIFGYFQQGLLDFGPVSQFPLSDFKIAMGLIDRREAEGRVILHPART